MQMILVQRYANEFSPENTIDFSPLLWNEPSFAYLQIYCSVIAGSLNSSLTQ